MGSAAKRRARRAKLERALEREFEFFARETGAHYDKLHRVYTHGARASFTPYKGVINVRVSNIRGEGVGVLHGKAIGEITRLAYMPPNGILRWGGTMLSTWEWQHDRPPAPATWRPHVAPERYDVTKLMPFGTCESERWAWATPEWPGDMAVIYDDMLTWHSFAVGTMQAGARIWQVADIHGVDRCPDMPWARLRQDHADRQPGALPPAAALGEPTRV